MKAVIFARGNDTEGQIAYCREYAARKGYEVVGVIVGQGRDLPEIVKGIGKKIDLVIARDMSRISRNMIEGYTIETDLESECGAVVEVADAESRSETEARFMRNLLLAVRENDAQNRIRSAYGRAIRGE